MLQRTKVAQYDLPIKITPQKGGGFTASCTIWPDCYAQGDTVDEAVLEITSVAQSLIDLYKEEELTIPLKKRNTIDLASPISLAVLSTS